MARRVALINILCYKCAMIKIKKSIASLKSKTEYFYKIFDRIDSLGEDHWLGLSREITEMECYAKEILKKTQSLRVEWQREIRSPTKNE